MQTNLSEWAHWSDDKEAFLKVIEEMRREFPDYLMFDPDYSKSDPYITHQKWTLDSKNAFLKTERDKWFENWFSKKDNE